MSHFDPAVTVVLQHEGGFVDNKNDPGGATNWGISLRWLQKQGINLDLDFDGDTDADDIRLLPRVKAIKLYRRYFWDQWGYEKISDQHVATKVFDLCVNMGSRQAHLLTQRALRAVGWPVTEDGILGPVTLARINASRGSELLPALRSEAAGFYRLLAFTKSELREFLNGWLRRAYA